MVVLVAFELRSYSEAIGGAIQILRPHVEVAIAEPDELGAKVARLDPELVLCSRSNITGRNDKPAWVEFRPYEWPGATVYVGGGYSKLEQVEFADLLAVVDLTEDLMRADLAIDGC
ncbi:MAG: hypothetical protein QOI57_2187 [Rubrobacteraceae bacterium]|jgi:hypothetical protein|nr:hypothetical protein [Rubrobacteraceae bacterium]